MRALNIHRADRNRDPGPNIAPDTLWRATRRTVGGRAWLCGLLISLLLLGSDAATRAQNANTSGALSALQALQLLPKADAAKLARIEAREGIPAPERWYLIVHDPTSPNGLREFVVGGREIVAARDISQFAKRVQPAEILGRDSLRVDSSEAARVALEYAYANGLQVYSLNYELSKAGEKSAPIWKVTCLNARGESIGEIAITAILGSVISHEGFAIVPPSRNAAVKATASYAPAAPNSTNPPPPPAAPAPPSARPPETIPEPQVSAAASATAEDYDQPPRFEQSGRRDPPEPAAPPDPADRYERRPSRPRVATNDNTDDEPFDVRSSVPSRDRRRPPTRSISPAEREPSAPRTTTASTRSLPSKKTGNDRASTSAQRNTRPTQSATPKLNPVQRFFRKVFPGN